MDNLIVYFIIFIFIEFLEASWQRESSLNRVFLKNYHIYKAKGLVWFLSLNISFFYTLYLAFLLNNFSFWMVCIILMKFLDISLKLYFFQRLDSEGEEAISNFFPEDLSMNGLIYINLIIYTSAMFFALFL